MTKTEIEKLLNQKISKNNLKIYKEMDKALQANNFKLFNILASQLYVDKYFVSKDEYQESRQKLLNLLDEIYGFLKHHIQEQTVMGHTAQKHEIRITKLESALA